MNSLFMCKIHISVRLNQNNTRETRDICPLPLVRYEGDHFEKDRSHKEETRHSDEHGSLVVTTQRTIET